MKKIIFFLVVFFTLSSSAQNKDSILKAIPAIKNEAERIHAMYEILGDDNGDSREQLYYHRKLLDVTRKINDKVGEAIATAELGYSIVKSGNSADGLKMIFDALTIAENIKSQYALGIVYDNLAVCYDDPLKKMEYLKTALLASQSANDYLFVCFELGNIAVLYIRQNNFDSALYYNQRAIEIATARNLKEIIPGALIQIAYIQKALGHKAAELRYYYAALNHPYTARDIRMQATVYGALSYFYSGQQNIDSALYYGYKSYESSLNTYYSFQMMPCFLLWQLYAGIKNSDSALKYATQYYTVRDSINSNQKIMQMQTLVMLNDQRAEKTKEAYQQEQDRLHNQVIIFSLATALLLIGAIAFFLYRNNAQKQKANNLIQKQKQQTDEQRVKAEKALEDLQSTQSQLIQSEKMASLGELTAGIAHEIQNPLNFVNNFSEVSNEMIDEMKEELATGNLQLATEIADDIKQNLEKINHHGKRADAIVKGMLQHSRKSEGKKEPTDINALCDEYLRLAYHGLRAKDKSFNTDFKTDFDESLDKINIVPQDIGRVLLNLYNNAFYAVNEKLTAHRSPLTDDYKPLVSVQTKRINDKVEIRVADNGNGIPQNIVDKIFQPFFTTKPTGQGTGLGLSLAYDIITKEHNGTIKVESRQGEGSLFIVQLPT